MTSSLIRALRRYKPERRIRPLRPRDPRDLLGASDAPPGRFPLLLDTNVYIAEAAGTLPPAAVALIDRALLFHCSVCIGELACGVANGDPRHPRWPATRDHYAEVLTAIPETRMLAPDRNIWMEAGIVAGLLSRTQGFQPNQRKELMNDALIYLTAARHGLGVLTSNRDEFDLIQRIAPHGTVYHY